MKKKIVPLLLVVFCLFSSLVLTACHGEGFEDVDQLTCTVGMTEDKPLKYNQVWYFDFYNKDEYTEVLANHGLFHEYFSLPSESIKNWTFTDLVEHGATITGWDPTTPTNGTPRTMNVTFGLYTCTLYYTVDPTPQPPKPNK